MQKDIRQFSGYIQTHCTYIRFEKAPHEMSESPKPSIFQFTEISRTLFNTNLGTKVYGEKHIPNRAHCAMYFFCQDDFLIPALTAFEKNLSFFVSFFHEKQTVHAHM